MMRPYQPELRKDTSALPQLIYYVSFSGPILEFNWDFATGFHLMQFWKI
jgi:hypothetical protein